MIDMTHAHLWGSTLDQASVLSYAGDTTHKSVSQ